MIGARTAAGIAGALAARTGSDHGAPGAVTVHSQGGLGNQLFIYGAGLAAARSAGARLRIDTGQHSARADRPSQLQELGFAADYVDLGYVHPDQSTGVRGRLAQRSQAPHSCTFRERTFPYDARLATPPAGSCTFGYFQSWRYLAPVQDELRQQFATLAAARPPIAEVLDPDALVVHVRRGDYLHAGAKGYHGIAGVAYYRRAVQVLRRMGYNGTIAVVSDDLPAALDMLGGLGDVRPLVTATVTDPVDELLAMSTAPALVTANSSFSWWAGWIGDRRAGAQGAGRPIISPRPWFDDAATDARDLLPPHWLTLDRRDDT